MIDPFVRSRRRRSIALALALALSALTLVGCGSSAEGSRGSSTAEGGDDAPEAENMSVVLVTPENAGDNGPTDNLLAGLEQVESLGHSTRHIASTDPSAHESTLRNVAESGADIVVVAFQGFVDAVKVVAPSFPDTRFIHVYADAYEPEMDNVQNITFDTQGPSYLAGVLAATLSETGSIGFIGGQAIPQLNADFRAYEAGALATRDDLTIRSAFVGDWGDPVKGQQVAKVLFDSGVDVVLAYAGGSSLGVVRAADEVGGLVIYDNAESADTAQSVIALASQHYGGSMHRQVEEFGETGWTAGEVRLGLAEEGTFLAPSSLFRDGEGPEAEAVAEAFEGVVAEVQRSIIEGETEVPYDPSAL